MVKIIAGPGDENAFLDNPYFNEARYTTFKYMTPRQRLSYVENLKATNQFEYNKLMREQEEDNLAQEKNSRENKRSGGFFSW
jgi:hypothetical protein